MATVGRASDRWLSGQNLSLSGPHPDWPLPTLALRRFAGRARIRLPQLDPLRRPFPDRVLFVSEHNVDRALMAAAFFNELADPARVRAICAGTEPPLEVGAGVVEALAEVGLAVPALPLRRLSSSLAMSAGELVIIGSAGSFPFMPGVRVQEWPLENPAGKPRARVRRVRNQIRRRVADMIERNDWGRGGDP